jgi:regulator of sirC expression with transglutaminase-like and TPR domain
MNPNLESLKSLILLLDDPDDQIYDHVSKEVKKFGIEAIPLLEESWEYSDLGELFQTRIEKITHEIQFDIIEKRLIDWKNSTSKDLIEAWLIISKWHFPGLEEKRVYDKIETIKKTIWLEINESQTAFEKVAIINKIIYEEFHFQGDTKNYHSPINSYINTVLETKHGNPLSLSILYSYISQSLNIPIYGINLPSHFLIGYIDQFKTNSSIGSNKSGVLFYINAFSEGSILYHADIKSFLEQLKITDNPIYYEPCSNTTIVNRILSNLISSYQQSNHEEKVFELSIFKRLLQ